MSVLTLKKIPPRLVPPRDDKYMGLAFMMAGFSKDPNTQVGAIIVDRKNHPLGWGYNGPPSEILDCDVNWGRPDK
jgi:dCMP deaminase